MRHEAWSAAGGSAKRQPTLHALLSKSDGNCKGSGNSQPLSGKKAPGKKSLHGIHHLFQLSLRTITLCMPSRHAMCMCKVGQACQMLPDALQVHSVKVSCVFMLGTACYIFSCLVGNDAVTVGDPSCVQIGRKRITQHTCLCIVYAKSVNIAVAACVAASLNYLCSQSMTSVCL